MIARKNAQPPVETEQLSAPTAAAIPLHGIGDAHAFEPVQSPAHRLREALHNAGFRTAPLQARLWSNIMVVLTMICIYVLSAMMLATGVTA